MRYLVDNIVRQLSDTKKQKKCGYLPTSGHREMIDWSWPCFYNPDIPPPLSQASKTQQKSTSFLLSTHFRNACNRWLCVRGGGVLLLLIPVIAQKDNHYNHFCTRKLKFMVLKRGSSLMRSLFGINVLHVSFAPENMVFKEMWSLMKGVAHQAYPVCTVKPLLTLSVPWSSLHGTQL